MELICVTSDKETYTSAILISQEDLTTVAKFTMPFVVMCEDDEEHLYKTIRKHANEAGYGECHIEFYKI